jgi:uncharacterized protein
MLNIKESLINALAVILGLFLIILAVSAIIDVKSKLEIAENTITVSGTGTVYSKPELALLNFSVIKESKTVAEAISENTEKMNAVIDFIKEQEIDNKDLKTTSFNVYPRYEWHETFYGSTGERVLTGYEVRQSLEVKIRDMEKIGVIIEGAAAAGANQVGDLRFTIDEGKQEELKKQAREEAIDKAKSKAEELAEQLEVKLVRISNFNESGQAVSPLRDGAMGMGEADYYSAPQVQTGENKIEVHVLITYEIN